MELYMGILLPLSLSQRARRPITEARIITRHHGFIARILDHKAYTVVYIFPVLLFVVSSTTRLPSPSGYINCVAIITP